MTNDEQVADIERRFNKMAREYAQRAINLVQWAKAGNVLPPCYRMEVSDE